MKKYSNVCSTVKPPSVRADEKFVYVSSDISESELNTESGETEIYSYNMTKYTKDEYIIEQAQQITELQLALIELL